MIAPQDHLQDLQDYKDRLFPNGGGRVREEMPSRMGGILAFLGPLLPRLPTCSECPQYGQAIIYQRKCYYESQCGLPAFIQIPRLNRILRKREEVDRDGSV